MGLLYDLATVGWNTGELMIRDDKADLGLFSYRNRITHTYHGKKAPHHPSPFHHYQIGSATCLASAIIAPFAIMVDLMMEGKDNNNKQPIQTQIPIQTVNVDETLIEYLLLSQYVK